MPGILESSRRHLDAVSESYWAHQRFATRTGFTMIGAGAALVIHGLAPFLFEFTGSSTIRRLGAIFDRRAALASTVPSAVPSAVPTARTVTEMPKESAAAANRKIANTGVTNTKIARG